MRRHLELIDIPTGDGGRTNLVTMQLPSGKWLLSSTANGFYDGNPGAVFRCYLLADGALAGDVQTIALGVVNGAVRGGLFAPSAAVDSATSRTITLRCDHFGTAPKSQFGPYFGPSVITAIRANSLDAADA